jgi:hypothetical protein
MTAGGQVMTDAERHAKRLCDDYMTVAGPSQRTRPNEKIIAQLIDSGLVTVNPPPDLVEQIIVAYFEGSDMTAQDRLRRLILAGWIVPGPACEGVEPDRVTAAEREVIAAAEAYIDWFNDKTPLLHPAHEVREAVRALREARS